MGKRSNYERVERDFYPTPWKAVKPLVSELPNDFSFAEPCAGDGSLVNHIETLVDGAWCSWASDIEPQKKGIHKKHFRDLSNDEFTEADYIITNPPWNRKLLHPMIEYFSSFRPTWLLFDADWIHTKQSIAYLPLLKKIVSIGRIKWIENSKTTGKDNCCWYLFDSFDSQTIDFIGRKL